MTCQRCGPPANVGSDRLHHSCTPCASWSGSSPSPLSLSRRALSPTPFCSARRSRTGLRSYRSSRREWGELPLGRRLLHPAVRGGPGVLPGRFNLLATRSRPALSAELSSRPRRLPHQLRLRAARPGWHLGRLRASLLRRPGLREPIHRHLSDLRRALRRAAEPLRTNRGRLRDGGFVRRRPGLQRHQRHKHHEAVHAAMLPRMRRLPCGFQLHPRRARRARLPARLYRPWHLSPGPALR